MAATFLAVMLAVLTRFLSSVERRPGVTLPDPILALFPASDVTWVTFTIIYAGLIAGLLVLARQPERLVIAVQSYGIMVLFRITAMYLLPLDPPPGMIALRDPFVQLFGTGQVLTKDLFFSGHTATMFLLFLADRNTISRMGFLAGTLVLPVFLLWQHVHYSVDILAAPAFAYAAYRCALRIRMYHIADEVRS